MDTRFKVIFLIAILVMCSLPIIGILKGPPLPVEEPDPPFSPSQKNIRLDAKKHSTFRRYDGRNSSWGIYSREQSRWLQ